MQEVIPFKLCKAPLTKLKIHFLEIMLFKKDTTYTDPMLKLCKVPYVNETCNKMLEIKYKKTKS